MNILYIADPKAADGCYYYRNFLPALYLKASKLADVFVNNKFQVKKDIDKKTGVEHKYIDVTSLVWADIVILSRYYYNPGYIGSEDQDTFLKLLVEATKAAGKKIVYEVDDDLFNVPTDNPVSEHAIKAREVVLHIMEYCDAYTVTTERLGAYLNTFFKKPTYALPNSLELFKFQAEPENMQGLGKELRVALKVLGPKKEGIVRIGWAGGRTHQLDLLSIMPALKWAKKEFPNIEIVTLCNKEMDNLFEFPHKNIPVVLSTIYPEILTSLNLDIGLCPLLERDFNKHKSPVKWEEYTAAGASVIYSDTPPYSDFITAGKTGYSAIPLASDTTKEDVVESWKIALRVLIETPDMRKKLTKNASRVVGQKFNMELNVLGWARAYQNILNQ